MKLIFKLTIVVTLAYLTVSNKIADDTGSKRYMQKEAYPDQYHAATNTTNLEYANYTSPFLSHVLFEEDPKKKLRQYEFTNAIRFNSYRLTKGEADQIFTYADANRDDLLDQNEWDIFTALYIMPFEACDRNHDYLLDESEFTECFEKDPKSRSIVFRTKSEGKVHSEIMWAITSRAKALINLHDYLFVRRSLFAWKNCQSNSKFISKGAFKCAIRTAVNNQKINLGYIIDGIYDVGVQISGDPGLIELDFPNYLRTLYSFFIFSTIAHPNPSGYIELSAFLKAIRYDLVPSNYQESEVNYLFDLIRTKSVNSPNQMNFASFAFFHNLHKLFNKYSSEFPLQITKSELLSLLKDETTPLKIVDAIDKSNTNFNTVEYQEASLILARKRPSEEIYYYSFKQDASENTAAIWNKTAANSTMIVENPESREYFFNTFALQNKKTWSKENYYLAFTLANLFVSLVPDSRNIVPVVTLVDRLMKQYDIVNPPINYTQRKNFPQYKFIPRETHVDLLAFSAIEFWRQKMVAVTTSSNSNIYESFAKMNLMDFGMKNLPDTVLDISKKGYDNLRRRTYDTDDLMKNVMIVQIVASEIRRSKNYVKNFDIKKNSDPSRKFPLGDRRSQASPYV